jgi:hypothetical protein
LSASIDCWSANTNSYGGFLYILDDTVLNGKRAHKCNSILSGLDHAIMNDVIDHSAIIVKRREE